MVIGWTCSRDLFETSWEGLHKVLPIVIAEDRRMFTCVLSLPQWRCYGNFEPLVSHRNVHAGCGRSWRAFLKWFLVEMILTTMHTLRPSIPWHNASLVRSYYAVLVHGLQRFPPHPSALTVLFGRLVGTPPSGVVLANGVWLGEPYRPADEGLGRMGCGREAGIRGMFGGYACCLCCGYGTWCCWIKLGCEFRSQHDTTPDYNPCQI